MENDAYRRSLVVELASHRENARHDQAAAVLAELERTGGIPAELEDTADHSPRETAVPKRGRPRKEP